MTLDGGKLPMQMDRVDEILNSAEIGIYRIILRKGEHPRLQGSAKLRELLGVDKDCRFTEEEFYDYWYSRIAPADVLSKGMSLDDIFDQDHFENTYRWDHPTLGLRYARCGGVVSVKEDGTRIMEGYHQDFTEQVERTMQDELVVKSLLLLVLRRFGYRTIHVVHQHATRHHEVHTAYGQCSRCYESVQRAALQALRPFDVRGV